MRAAFSFSYIVYRLRGILYGFLCVRIIYLASCKCNDVSKWTLMEWPRVPNSRSSLKFKSEFDRFLDNVLAQF